MVGAHQDMVVLQGMGEDLHDMEEGVTTNERRRGQWKFQFRYKVSIANTQNCHFTYCFFLTQIPEHIYILQKLQYLETILVYTIIIYN